MLPCFTDKGTGYAFLVIDYSQEHFLHFAIALDEDGSVWILDNTKVKFQKNVSLGRCPKSMGNNIKMDIIETLCMDKLKNSVMNPVVPPIN